MEKVYAQAVVALLETGTEIELVLTNLRSVMAARGHEKALPAVLRGIVRALEETAGATTPVVTVATAADHDALQAEIREALTQLGATTTSVRTDVDETIIGGLIATYNQRQIDASYRTKLTNLYHGITK
jgi:F0F1-type ATP synthase delta subunit